MTQNARTRPQKMCSSLFVKDYLRILSENGTVYLLVETTAIRMPYKQVIGHRLLKLVEVPEKW